MEVFRYYHAYAAEFEFDGWFHFFKNKELKKIGFPLKPDDVIVMSSNVHEWKGKPRSIMISMFDATDH